MNNYIIGDVQGCFDSLQALLTTISFNPKKDRLCFVGDLVNRGPKSLETLRFISRLKNPLITLGNHDLHCMALYFGIGNKNHSPTLRALFEAPDCEELMNFLLQQSLFELNDSFAMVHAGIPPQWSLTEAQHYANEVEHSLRSNPIAFFSTMYGDQPAEWSPHLSPTDRIRYCVNALTRMRFCTNTGELDLVNKTDKPSSPFFRSWFEWTQFDRDIYFGHWASLEGRCDAPRVYATDTGCVWGGQLTAIRTKDHKIIAIRAKEF